METLNPYQSPLTPGTSAPSIDSFPRYFVVAAPRGWLGFADGDTMQNLLHKHGARGDRLIASCTEAHDQYHFVFKSPEVSDIGKRKFTYRLAQAPRAKSLLKTLSGTMTEFMSTHFPEVENEWVPIAYTSNHQLVLTKAQELPPERMFDEYQIAHLPPVWWRTLFGLSYLKVIADQINTIAASGYEVITYLGDDYYLFGKRKPSHDTESPGSYRIERMGNVLRALLLGYASTCEKQLEQMREQGWELVTCNHSSFLFQRQMISSQLEA